MDFAVTAKNHDVLKSLSALHLAPILAHGTLSASSASASASASTADTADTAATAAPSLYLTQNQILLNNLLQFYQNREHLTRMLNAITGQSRMSLRIVDWFVTNYAKKNFTVFNIDRDNGRRDRFKVFFQYKLNLKAYTKRRFDPFCRWDRINIPYEHNSCIETTLGQLNFFKWAIENHVLDYIEANYDHIEHDMNARNSTSRNKEARSKTRKKRQELSVSATKSIKKEEVEIVVQFH